MKRIGLRLPIVETFSNDPCPEGSRAPRGGPCRVDPVTPKRTKPETRAKGAGRQDDRQAGDAKSYDRKAPGRSAARESPRPLRGLRARRLIEKALVIIAHPDDVDFGMAGTIATLTSRDRRDLLPRGLRDAGGDESVMAKEERAKLREDEQRAAAACVGVPDLVFLGYPDGTVEPTLALRRDLARVIRRLRPDVVLTQSPERNYDRIFASHPTTSPPGEAALRAVYPDARNPHAFPALPNDEGLEPHTVSRSGSAGRPGADDGGRHDRGDRQEGRGAEVPQEPARRRRPTRPHAARVGRHDRQERGPPKGPPRRGVQGHRNCSTAGIRRQLLAACSAARQPPGATSIRST